MHEQDEFDDLDMAFDNHLRRRHQIIVYASYYVAASIVTLAVIRGARASAFILLASVVMALVLGVTVGLLLLSRFIENEVQTRKIRRQMSNMQKAKRKPIARYEIGDDGEMYEVDMEQESQNQAHAR